MWNVIVSLVSPSSGSAFSSLPYISTTAPNVRLRLTSIPICQERAELYAAKAEAIEKEIETKLSRVKAALDDATARLVGRAAVNNSAKVVRFHRVTACYVTMRAKRASLGTLLEETLGAKENQEKVGFCLACFPDCIVLRPTTVRRYSGGVGRPLVEPTPQNESIDLAYLHIIG